MLLLSSGVGNVDSYPFWYDGNVLVVQHEVSSCNGWGAMSVTGRWSHTITSHCETCKSKLEMKYSGWKIVLQTLSKFRSTLVYSASFMQSWEGRRQRAVQRPHWHQFYTVLSFKSSTMKRPNMLTQNLFYVLRFLPDFFRVLIMLFSRYDFDKKGNYSK